MKTAIDKAGRVVIPKRVRDAAGLLPGTLLEIRFRHGKVEIEPAPREVRIASRGRVKIAVPVTPGETLTHEEVRRVQRALRDRRSED